MKTTIIIEKRLKGYSATLADKAGQGYVRSRAGKTPQDAATFAALEMVKHGQTNDEGGEIMAPPEVMELIPEHLRKIEGT